MNRIVANKAIDMHGPELYEARIIVGHNVNSTPTWGIADVRHVVHHARQRMGLTLGSTIIPAKGSWQPTIDVRPINEDTSVVLWLNYYDKLPARTFVTRVVALTRALRRQLRQSDVLARVTYKGHVVKQWIERDTREHKYGNKRRKP